MLMDYLNNDNFYNGWQKETANKKYGFLQKTLYLVRKTYI